ncbi:MAG: iron-containing alcohol dehydrogenase, partial [Weissella cibaria]
HLTEQYFDQANDTDIQDGQIEGLYRAVIKWAPIALATPDNYEARANLMWASTMALNGLVGSGKQNAWTVHPIEHELSAFYDITHGVGLGILTPRWMKFVLSDKTVAKFARFGRNVWSIQDDDDQVVAEKAIQATYDWVKSLEVPTNLPGVEITNDEHFQEMAESAVTFGLDNGYVPMTPADVVALYNASMTSDDFEK